MKNISNNSRRRRNVFYGEERRLVNQEIVFGIKLSEVIERLWSKNSKSEKFNDVKNQFECKYKKLTDEQTN